MYRNYNRLHDTHRILSRLVLIQHEIIIIVIVEKKDMFRIVRFKSPFASLIEALVSIIKKTLAIDFQKLILMPVSYQQGSFVLQEKHGNRLMSSPNYMVDQNFPAMLLSFWRVNVYVCGIALTQWKTTLSFGQFFMFLVNR